MHGLLCLYAEVSEVQAQTKSDCMLCHYDRHIKSSHGAKHVYVYVDTTSLQKSVHSKQQCISCHTDTAGNFPHPKKLKQVECLSCHQNDFKRLEKNNFLYSLRIRKTPVEIKPYNYIEKARYWTLIWNLIILAVTRAVLTSLSLIVYHWFIAGLRAERYILKFTTDANGQVSVKHSREKHPERFKQVLIEWFKAKSRKSKRGKMSRFTRRVVSTLVKNKVELKNFFISEIENDAELTKLVQNIIKTRENE